MSFCIGRDTSINGTYHIDGVPGAPICIGNFCAIGPNFTAIAHNHDIDYPAVQYKFYEKYFGTSHPGVMKQTEKHLKGYGIKIGSDVWIGEGVIILPGVRIGDGAIIGAHSVVTRDVPAYAIACGNPARVVKYRYCKEKIEFLLELAWWNWSDDRICRNREFFSLNIDRTGLDDIKSVIKA